MLVEEVRQTNESGKKFDIASSVSAQISFFTCFSHIFDKGIQRDIQRYLYCKETSVPPYKGDYGSQPAIWVDRFFLIKEALAKYEKRIIDDSKKHSNNKI